MVDLNAAAYLSPSSLAVSKLELRRVLLVGNCIFDGWIQVLGDLQPGIQVDHVAYSQTAPQAPLDESYDLKILQVPLRIVHSEWRLMALSYDNPGGFEQAFQTSLDLLRMYVDMAGEPRWDRPTFFLNYLAPQQNAYGRLMPRYDLRNPVHFVELLNQELSRLADAYPGGHVLDADQVAGVLGRRFFQDDAFWVTAHGGLIGDADWPKDIDRLEPSQPISARYPIDTQTFIAALWREAFAMLRTIRGVDHVKMVCVDLDDTLWRGVLAEESGADFGVVEGWPLGLAEALGVLRQRGVILAIVSRNDEARIAEIWPNVYGARFPLEAFPIRKINWGVKVDSLRQAMAEANVLPDSVLFIDDNPVERAQAEAAFPGLRTLGAPHLDWRRILLWSPETQMSGLTDESARRNEMISAQVVREERRTALSRDVFLQDLGLSIELDVIRSAGAIRFERALELLNKTNQFNTAGRRWTKGEADELFACGGEWTVFSVSDRYVQYGLVGVLVCNGSHLSQYVMSCRVFGLDVETAVLGELTKMRGVHSAALVETPKNGPCRNIFLDAGWRAEGEIWIAGPLSISPAHIAVSWRVPAPAG